MSGPGVTYFVFLLLLLNSELSNSSSLVEMIICLHLLQAYNLISKSLFFDGFLIATYVFHYSGISKNYGGSRLN